MRWGTECRAAVWLAVAATACGAPAREPAGDDDRCRITDRVVVDLPADPPLELQIESCRIDVDACPRVCTFVSERDGLDPFHGTCEVVFGSDQVTITFGYSEWSCG